jgi:hypothetical protein
VPRDDEDVVAKSAYIKVFEYSEGVRPDGRQARVGRAVEKLERRDVGLEVPVTDELIDSFSIAHQGARLALVPESVGVADAVGAVQRTPLHVVQTQPTLAVLNDLSGALGQPIDLVPAKQWDDGTHVVLSQEPEDWTWLVVLFGRVGRHIASYQNVS